MSGDCHGAELGRGRTLPCVSDQVLHIAVDVNYAGEEIHGQVCDGVRAPRPFSGWLGLIGALDSMMCPEDRDAAAPAVGTGDPVRGVQPGGKR